MRNSYLFLAALCGLLALAVLACLLLFPLPVYAADPIEGYQPLTIWTNYCTNRAALFLTNSSGGAITIDCSRQRNVTVRLMIQNDATGTDNDTFYLYSSVDGNHYSSSPASIISVAGGTAGVAMEYVTNIDTLGAHSFKFGYMTNTGTAAAANTTNFAVGYDYKTQAP